MRAPVRVCQHGPDGATFLTNKRRHTQPCYRKIETTNTRHSCTDERGHKHTDGHGDADGQTHARVCGAELTSPGTVNGGDGGCALYGGDEGRLEVKQVAGEVWHAAEGRRVTAVRLCGFRH